MRIRSEYKLGTLLQWHRTRVHVLQCYDIKKSSGRNSVYVMIDCVRCYFMDSSASCCDYL